MKNLVFLNCAYLALILTTVFQSHESMSGFGKGFGAGVGTFLGVSMLSNAIAQNNQPRVVYVNQPQQPYYSRFQHAQSNQNEQIKMLEQENQSRALAIEEEKLRLRAKELEIKEAQLRLNN